MSENGLLNMEAAEVTATMPAELLLKREDCAPRFAAAAVLVLITAPVADPFEHEVLLF